MKKDKIIEKWSKTGLLEGLYHNQSTFDGNIQIIDSGNTLESFDFIQFPMVKRVMATTVANGGWIKSKKQQLKEDRINKLRKLKGKKPNVILEKDEYVNGLIPVQPLSASIGQFFYMDYKYGETEEEKRKKKQERKKKLEGLKEIEEIEGGVDFINNLQLKIIRKDKLKYIDTITRI